MKDVVTAKPKIILEKGKPVSVILDFASYQELLEKAEDIDDSREIRQLKKQKLNFRPLEEYLASR